MAVAYPLRDRADKHARNAMDPLDEVRHRLARLEEAVGFAQHDQDAFSVQLAAIQHDVRALDARLRRLEATVQQRAARHASSAGSDADSQSPES